jgi:predicted kinase
MQAQILEAVPDQFASTLTGPGLDASTGAAAGSPAPPVPRPDPDRHAPAAPGSTTRQTGIASPTGSQGFIDDQQVPRNHAASIATGTDSTGSPGRRIAANSTGISTRYNDRVRRKPILVVVSGPPGAGKTTLAHHLARRIGCPAICRDEIKEGMVHATGTFIAAPNDDLTLRTLPTFFQVLQLLLDAGVTTVAEAAFQDHLWRPNLQPLQGLADLRIVHCQVTAQTANTRIQHRQSQNPTRRAHADPHLINQQSHAARHDSFHRVHLDVPQIDVDTSHDYHPTLEEIITFLDTGR